MVVTMKSETKELPIDIVHEILVHLPVKTLIRFRSVCKSWNSLITHLTFQEDHYRRHQQNPLVFTLDESHIIKDRLLSTYSYSKGGFTLVNEFSTTLDSTGRDCECCYEYAYYRIQSCLGLVCISNNRPFDVILLCNPSTEEVIALPRLCRPRDCVGLGYVSSNREFKVVSFFEFNSEKYCKVFTLGTSYWREARSPPQTPCSGDAPFLHGALHLVLLEDDRYSMAAFDIETEEYKMILMPEQCSELGISKDPTPVCELKVLQGSLCLLCKDGMFALDMSIWLLKDYNSGEWVKEYNIDFSQISSFEYCRVDPLAIMPDGRIMLQVWTDHNVTPDGILLCYNPEDKSLIENKLECFRAELYVESFQSLSSKENICALTTRHCDSKNPVFEA